MKNNKSKQKLDFESAFDELQSIQDKIDSGDLSLDDSVELYLSLIHISEPTRPS